MADLVPLGIGALRVSLIISPILLADKVVDDVPVSFQDLIRAQNHMGVDPLVRIPTLDIIELENVVSARTEPPIEQERALPFTERPVGLLEFPKLRPNILLVLYIVLQRCKRALLKINPAIAEIRSLVSKKSGSLLHGIGVPDTDATRHVRHSEALDRETTIHRLATNDDPAIHTAPVYLWGLTCACIHLKDACI
jgi:hypothetical protein